ncbi:MAG: O-antigen ligase domain-containing protein [Sphingobacteriales bacterium]|nr:MAG: O-antigen ligase domain-containing protein [Sphingobacteriales bacterium]
MYFENNNNREESSYYLSVDEPQKRKGINPVILASILILFSALFAVAISNFGVKSFYVILVGIFVLPVAYTIVAYPKAGIYILLTLAYLIMFTSKLGVDYPVGTVMDAIEGLMLLGVIIRQRRERNWGYFNNAISVMILIWIGYNLVEALNPVAASRLAWVYTVRTVAVVAITYFIFLYYIRDVKFIRNIMKLWIALSFIGAAYAFKQEYFGFAGFELAWLDSSPKYKALYFIAGSWRKFSIFTDPMTFSYNMVVSSILCFALMVGPYSTKQKVLLAFLGVFFFVAMLFSGTRSAYVLLPAAAMLFMVLKYNKKVFMAVCVLAMAMVVLIKMPTGNHTLYRFQTAFKPSDDASFNLRAINQKKIQPYIQSHPMGGGLGATGVWGERFSPNSFLAKFPPDSGYVRVAVEMGWVGLLIFCTYFFFILKTGITNYFRIKDPELKTYCLAMVLIVFALNIGNYPQEGLVQYPINVYFNLVLALIVVTWKLDQQKRLINAS